jgi:signal transduction histidine kinase
VEFVDLCVRHAADAIENAQLYAEIREAARRKDEFLAMLAHELRNPLAPITNSLEIMRLAGELSPTMEEVRAMMHRQVRHMTRLVDDLLEVSRLTRGKLELRREVVDLASILATAVDTCRPAIDARRHQFAVSIARHPIRVHADSVRITQVVANLLNNAAKYTPEGGQLWLTARAEDGQAVISVRDTGVGIEPEMLSRVFELFVQVEESLHRSDGGLGIGLTLARRLVEMHDGSLEARSGGAGQGSEFIVRLPLAETGPPAPARRPALLNAGTPDSAGD